GGTGADAQVRSAAVALCRNLVCSHRRIVTKDARFPRQTAPVDPILAYRSAQVVREATVCAQTLASAQVKPADDPVPRRAGTGVLGGGRHVLSNHYGAAPASKRLLLLLLLLLFPLLLLAQRAQGQPQIVARLFERLFHLAVAVLAKHGP